MVTLPLPAFGSYSIILVYIILGIILLISIVFRDNTIINCKHNFIICGALSVTWSEVPNLYNY